MKKGVDYVGIGVGAVILNKEKKLFLALRGNKAKNERGKWEVPGGGVEFGETLEQTIVREMKEEFEIDVEVIDKLGLYNHILPEEKQHWVATSFICKLIHGSPKILEPEKNAEFGWYTLDEAEKLTLSLLGKYDIQELRKKYPEGLPNLYTHTYKK